MAPPGILGHNVHLSDPIGTYSPRCPDCVGVHGGERMKAECVAKRAVIRDSIGLVSAIEALSAALPGSPNQEPDAPWRTATLRHLAAVYADHPDYDKSWAL